MGFWEKIFGEKKREKKTIIIEINELNKYVEGKTAFNTKELEKTAHLKLSEIIHLLKEIQNQLEKLKQKKVSTEEGNLRLRKVVKTSQSNLFLQLNSLIKKLQPPQNSNLDNLMEYSNNSLQLLSKGIFASRKNIVYAKTILAEDINNIGKYINELNQAFTELKKNLDESSIKELQIIKKRIPNVSSFLNEKKVLFNSLNEKNNEIKNFIAKKEIIMNQLDELNNSPQFNELKDWEIKKGELFKKKQLLKEKFITLIGEVEKPLNRFLQLVSSKKYIIPKEEEELLNLYLQNFLFAIKKDPKAITLNKLLNELEKMLQDSTIVLKEKEKDKKLSTLQDLIEFDFDYEIFQKLKYVESEIVSIDSKIKNFSLNQKCDSLQNEITLIEREISEKNSLVENINSKISAQQNNILSEKESLENDLNQFFGEEILIKIPS